MENRVPVMHALNDSNEHLNPVRMTHVSIAQSDGHFYTPGKNFGRVASFGESADSEIGAEEKALHTSVYKALLVRPTGLEPVLLAEHAPQTCAYANSATAAYRQAASKIIAGGEGFVKRFDQFCGESAAKFALCSCALALLTI